MSTVGKLSKWIGVAVFGYLFLLAVNYPQTDYQPIITVAIALSTWLALKTLIRACSTSVQSALRTAIALIAFGALIRLLWAVFVPTTPVSDFSYYHQYALDFSQGIVSDNLPKNAGYPMLLSLGYRIFPGPITGRLINAIASSITIVLIFHLGSELAEPSVGIISAFLFAILPSEINMVSVLGTEVTSTALLVATLYSVVLGTKQAPKLRYTYISGLFLGIGLVFRSSILFYVPVFILFLFRSSMQHSLPGSRPLAAFVFGTITTLLVLAVSHSLAIGRPSIALLKMQDSFPFLSGTNTNSGGMWNQDDVDLYYSWPEADRNALARQEAARRISSNPLRYLAFIPRKISQLMSSNTYGDYWSIHFVDWQQLKKPQNLEQKMQLINGALSQSIYVIVLGLALLAFILHRISIIPTIALVAVLSTLLPYFILEVQPRYHHQLMPIMILCASYGFLKVIKMAALT